MGSVTGDVIRTGKAVVLADASADPRSAQPIVAAGAGPAVFIPLAVRGRILGTLTVANGRGGPLLRDSEVQLVETFAEQAAVALEYGRLRSNSSAWPSSGPRADRQSCTRPPSRPVRGRHGLQGSPSWPGDDELRGRLHTPSESWTGHPRLRNYIFGPAPRQPSPTASSTSSPGAGRRFRLRTGVLAIAVVDPAVAAELTVRPPTSSHWPASPLVMSRHAEAAHLPGVAVPGPRRRPSHEVDDDSRGFDPPRGHRHRHRPGPAHHARTGPRVLAAGPDQRALGEGINGRVRIPR
jgi:hypothetical protein